MIDFSDGKVCPYCLSHTEYTDSIAVYQKSYGMIYLCRRCKAWVGVHKGTSNALGRLADSELRNKKKEAHKYFDNLWHRKMQQGFNKGHARAKAYTWLAKTLAIDPKDMHIGMMDVDGCEKIIDVCKRYYREA